MSNKIKIPKVKISVKMNCNADELFSIKQPSDIVKVIRSIISKSEIIRREHMILLLLNRANKVVGYEQISCGGVSGTVCDPKVVFTTALNCNASAIVLAHNHPSGNLLPSDADISITRKIQGGAELLDMVLLDHIIITDSQHYSFKEDSSYLD